MASEAQRGPVQRLQSAVEHLAGKDGIPEGVYLDACNALKQIHSLGKLYRVHYTTFYEDTGDILHECSEMIVPLHMDATNPRTCREWVDILRGAPMLNAIPPLPDSPVEFCGRPTMITGCELYLKRARYDEQ